MDTNITTFSVANNGKIIVNTSANNKIVIEFNNNVYKWLKKGILDNVRIMGKVKACDDINTIRNNEGNITGIEIYYKPIGYRLLHRMLFDTIIKQYAGIID